MTIQFRDQLQAAIAKSHSRRTSMPELNPPEKSLTQTVLAADTVVKPLFTKRNSMPESRKEEEKSNAPTSPILNKLHEIDTILKPLPNSTSLTLALVSKHDLKAKLNGESDPQLIIEASRLFLSTIEKVEQKTKPLPRVKELIRDISNF